MSSRVSAALVVAGVIAAVALWLSRGRSPFLLDAEGPVFDIPATMRAVVMRPCANAAAACSRGPEILAVDDAVPTPKAPDAAGGEIMLLVHATAVNRADTVQRRGLYAPPPGASEILGLEAAGVVVAGSTAVHKRGTRVMCLVDGGAYARYVVAHETHCWPVPAGMNTSTAASIPEVFLTGYQAMRIAGFGTRPFHPFHALIHAGASGLGTALCRLVRAFGGVPLITASKAKLQDARVRAACAVDEAASNFFERDNAPAGELPRWVGAIRAKLGGDNVVDFVVDPVVGSGYLRGDLELLKVDGTIIVLATMAGNTIDGGIDANRLILRKRASIVGSTLRARSWPYKTQLVADFLKHAWPLKLDSLAVISHVWPIEDVQKAHALVDNGESIGKIVLTL